MDPRWARFWFAATAIAVVIGVAVDFVLAWQTEVLVLPDGREIERFGGSGPGRAFNLFAFFTIQSNLIVGGTSLWLALDRPRDSTWFAVLRLIGIIAITVTFVVFHATLAGLLILESWAKLADTLLHTVVPVMAVTGWLIFGPRGLTSARVAFLSFLFPLFYMALTIIRGAISDWYPYPFADVNELGYAQVLINGFWVGALFVGLALIATALDRRLGAPDDLRAPAPVDAPS